MRKQNETCVKVVYKGTAKAHNPSKIKGSLYTYAKTLDFTGRF